MTWPTKNAGGGQNWMGGVKRQSLHQGIIGENSQNTVVTLGSLEIEENSVVNPKDPKNQAKTIHEGFSKAGIWWNMKELYGIVVRFCCGHA